MITVDQSKVMKNRLYRLFRFFFFFFFFLGGAPGIGFVPCMLAPNLWHCFIIGNTS